MISQRLTMCVCVLLASSVTGCAMRSPAPEPAHSAVLIVSLEDGSVIRQDIEVDADICMKVNEDTMTTCLTRSEPIMDAQNHRVIGYRMRRTQIDLYPVE